MNMTIRIFVVFGLSLGSPISPTARETSQRGVPIYGFPYQVLFRVSTLFGIVSMNFYSEALYAESRLEDFDEVSQYIKRETVSFFDQLREQPMFIFTRDPVGFYRKRRLLAEIDASFPIQLELRSNVTDSLESMHSGAHRILLSACLRRSNELKPGESELTRLVSEFRRTQTSPVRFHSFELVIKKGLFEVVSPFPKLLIQVRFPHSLQPTMTDLSVWEFTDWTTLHMRVLFGGSPPKLPFTAKTRRGAGEGKLKLQVLVEEDGTIIVGCKLGDVIGSVLVMPRDKDYLRELVSEKAKIRKRHPERYSYVDWDAVEKLCDSVIAIV